MLIYYSCVLLAIVYLVCFVFSPFSTETVSRRYQIVGRNHRLPDQIRFPSGQVPLATTQHVQESLMSMLGSVQEILDSCRLTYWAVGHTLYGAQFTNGLLPWVDSIELGFLFDREEHTKLVGSRPSFHEAGLDLLRRRNVYRVVKKGSCFPFIDLWMMAEKEGGVAVCTPLSELNECTFLDSYRFRRRMYEKEHVFPLQSGMFEGWYVPMPAEPESCIQVHYGENYQLVDWADTSHLDNARVRAVLNSCSESVLCSG